MKFFFFRKKNLFDQYNMINHTNLGYWQKILSEENEKRGDLKFLMLYVL